MNNYIYTLQNSLLSYPGAYSSIEDLTNNALRGFSSFDLSCCTILSGWVAVKRKITPAGHYREESRVPLTLAFNENNTPYFINQ